MVQSKPSSICQNTSTKAAVFQILQGENYHDEIEDYLNGRYLGSAEAAWRIFGFPITGRHPAVMKLSIHLENGQRVYYNAENTARIINEQLPRTNLTAFF